MGENTALILILSLPILAICSIAFISSSSKKRKYVPVKKFIDGVLYDESSAELVATGYSTTPTAIEYGLGYLVVNLYRGENGRWFEVCEGGSLTPRTKEQAIQFLLDLEKEELVEKYFGKLKKA